MDLVHQMDPFRPIDLVHGFCFDQQLGKAGFETEASEMIKALQVELMAIRLKEAESDHNGKELEAKLEQAVEVSKRGIGREGR